jgi:catechol 2,3-dioxygenase-like lactoylglutathione lyase family enzyme
VRKLQSQGVHHITLVGADRQTSIGFWEGVLGMPFVFEQPNLDNEAESHLYFDPGDGRLITVFTSEEREPDPTRTSTDIGCVHHIAFALSQATFRQAVERLDERGIGHSGVRTAASWTRSRGAYNIAEEHLADAIETLAGRSRASLSEDRSPQNPYR